MRPLLKPPIYTRPTQPESKVRLCDSSNTAQTTPGCEEWNHTEPALLQVEHTAWSTVQLDTDCFGAWRARAAGASVMAAPEVCATRLLTAQPFCSPNASFLYFKVPKERCLRIPCRAWMQTFIGCLDVSSEYLLLSFGPWMQLV